MFEANLQKVDLVSSAGDWAPGLVAVHQPGMISRPDEGAVIRDAAAFQEVAYVFFRRFSDGRSSQPAAFVVDNSDERMDEQQLAQLHNQLWLHGVAPLLYVAWPTRIDILTCARGPDFWKNENYAYSPVEQIETAVQIESELRKRRRFSALRLANGTFWDDPNNASFANHNQTAHESLIQAIVEVDAELEGARFPVLRRLLLLTVLIKYLEDRRVFPRGWFGRFCKGKRSFFQVLQHGDPANVLRLLQTLEKRFNGDIFLLPTETGQELTATALRKLAVLVEARTLGKQRYLWEQYSFEHLPVDIISHLYQRFVHGHGTVYTPPFLASLILDHAMPYDQLTGNERVIDPACGSGVFLVGAFRRLVNLWRSRNKWNQPDVKTLQAILTQSIFGVELDSGAVDLTAFSLSLAVCDALRPNIIWRELRFEALRGKNLIQGDFFDCVGDQPESAQSKVADDFNIVIGNPPFESELTDAGQHVNRQAENERGRLPDKQSAYLFLEQCIKILKPGGRICLVQPSGFLYNRRAIEFRQHIMRSYRVPTLFDFTSIRNLYDGADPKTIAVLAERKEPAADDLITHLTFRRTFTASQRIGFEIDHYDRHRVPQPIAERDPLIWRTNLLGGGRLTELSERLRSTRTLGEFVEQQGWLFGEGFIVGNRRHSASFLTEKPLLSGGALTSDGIDESKVDVVRETGFEGPRSEEMYQAPLVLIREHESLPAIFWDKGEIAYKNEIVGIHAAPESGRSLKRFFKTFQQRVRQYQFCIAISGSRAFSTRATAVYKNDIEALPYPEQAAELDFTFWETALMDDVLEYMAPYVRLGQNSDLLRKKAEPTDLSSYAKMFCRLLESIYNNLNSASPIFLDGLICQPFYFGDAPDVELSGSDFAKDLQDLIYDNCFDSLITVRVVRIYHRNAMFIVKPDRLRYWIQSTAIRDADDTLIELHKQGY